MASLNQCTLIGNVGKDPEIRRTNTGVRVASFSVATSETWTDKGSGERKEATDWHNVVVWGPNDGGDGGMVGVVEKYVRKGNKIAVQGPVKTRKWQDQSGNDRYMTEVVLRPFNGTLVLLGDKGEGGGARRGPESPDDYGSVKSGDKAGTPRKTFSQDIDDEIPF